MRINNLYIGLLLTAVTLFTGCKYDDLQDDVDDLKDRVTLLQEQVQVLNENVKVVANMMDENLAISNCQKNGKESFTLTFTNGETLTLKVGSESKVQIPEITVKDNMWVVNGKVIGGPVVSDKAGVNGQTPLFKLQLDTEANRYYWMVSTDGGNKYEEVLDETGNRAYVTVNEKLPSDPYFASAGVSEDGKYFEIHHNDGTVLKVEIAQNLVCQILNEEKTVAVDAGAKLTVQAKVIGDDYVVYEPYGWKAQVGVPNADNILEIVLTAPAQQISRASADNLTDLVVMVKKGNFWAVDKMTLTVK